MHSKPESIPIGNFDPLIESTVRSSVTLGDIVRERRRLLALKQLELAGLGNTGNRFIVELEQGKPTVQLQKVLDVLDLLGLEVVVRPKAGAGR
ncbi:MAG: transcriptional regulator [Rhodoferax sp.]|uniref:transcriptional regulator n=1 Tax=Rhodoferax sp. TaxID=50421 RepID=UPI002628FF35|nr:transcriptional regulator [Rhodoferax sp.]MDD5334570.1 transcriptional regulator [Rhodoferax sp.]